MSTALLVRLGSRSVGLLQPGSDGRIVFRFFGDYCRLGHRPVLGQHFEDDLSKSFRSRRRTLPAWFANLLPEGDLRAVICRQHKIESADDLALLRILGADLPGAVVVEPWSQTSDFEDRDPSMTPSVEPSDAEAPLCFSLAGVQLKLSLSRHDDRWTPPVQDDDGEWIGKIAWTDRFAGVADNEFATMGWAAEAGFDVPRCELSTVANIEGPPKGLAPSTPVFLTKRYDRTPQGRVHQEDFAQVFNLSPDHKYEQVTFETMGRLVYDLLGSTGLREWVARVALMIATANADAHLKNWSLLYPDGIRPIWTPVYDQLCTKMYEVDDELALKLGGSKDWTQLDRKRFEWLAGKLGVPAEEVLGALDDAVERLQEAWKRVESSLPFSEIHRDALREQWQRVPILRTAGGL